MNKSISRRQFIRRLCAFVALPIAAQIGNRQLMAQNEAEMPGKLSESDPIAESLGYKTDAQDVDTELFPKRTGAGRNQYCSNCSFFASSKDGDEWAPCSLYDNQLVSAMGWCNGWVPKG